jgi:amino acid transporter
MPGMATDSTSHSPPHGGGLIRTMGLFSLIVYGVGDMVGAGIYGTVGTAAALLGNAVWMAFVGSMIAAMLTGLSYASLASRYPRAGGAAYVIQRAFRQPLLAYLIGLAVVASGMTSMAGACHAFREYMEKLTGLPAFTGSLASGILIIGALLGFLTIVNFIGLRQSMWANLVCTGVEVAGLLFVIWVGIPFWGSIDYFEGPQGPTVPIDVLAVLSGAVLTFYAFIGFEDMLNVSEEVKNPERTMPLGIIITIFLVTILYMAVAITVVSVVPAAELHEAAITKVVDRAAPWLPRGVFDWIPLFAVANTALINFIMGSRLLYGMANQGLLPKIFSRVHPVRHTPYLSIFTLGLIVAALATLGKLEHLAVATSLLLLVSFSLVNAGLLVLQLRPGEPKGAFEVPSVVPAAGIVVSLVLIVARLSSQHGYQAPIIAGVILLVILALYWIQRPPGQALDSI